MQMLSDDAHEAKPTQRDQRTKHHCDGDEYVKLIRREGAREITIFEIAGRNCARASHADINGQSGTEVETQLVTLVTRVARNRTRCDSG